MTDIQIFKTVSMQYRDTTIYRHTNHPYYTVQLVYRKNTDCTEYKIHCKELLDGFLEHQYGPCTHHYTGVATLSVTHSAMDPNLTAEAAWTGDCRKHYVCVEGGQCTTVYKECDCYINWPTLKLSICQHRHIQ